MKKNMEVALILFAGLATLYLSINSVIKSNKLEDEIKTKADSLSKSQRETIVKQDELSLAQQETISLQKEYHESLQSKSNKIIELQAELRSKSEQQLSEINRIKNPIPNEIGLTFESMILMNEQELNGIREALKQRLPYSNTLPIETILNNKGLDKVNLLKDAGFSMTVRLIADKGILTLNFAYIPIPLAGFNTTTMGLFKCYYNDAVRLMSVNMRTRTVESNYTSASLADFTNCKIEIYYDFSYPQLMRAGDKIEKLYVSNREKIELQISSTLLYIGGQNVQIAELKKTDVNRYSGKCTINIK